MHDDEPKLRAIAAGLTADEKGKLLGILTEDVLEESLGNIDELLAEVAKSSADVDTLLVELAGNTDKMLNDMAGDGSHP